jgi:hypothetical protein
MDESTEAGSERASADAELDAWRAWLRSGQVAEERREASRAEAPDRLTATEGQALAERVRAQVREHVGDAQRHGTIQPIEIRHSVSDLLDAYTAFIAPALTVIVWLVIGKLFRATSLWSVWGAAATAVALAFIVWAWFAVIAKRTSLVVDRTRLTHRTVRSTRSWPLSDVGAVACINLRVDTNHGFLSRTDWFDLDVHGELLTRLLGTTWNQDDVTRLASAFGVEVVVVPDEVQSRDVRWIWSDAR